MHYLVVIKAAAKTDGSKYANTRSRVRWTNAQVDARFKANKELQETILWIHLLITVLMGNETYKWC